MFPSARTSVKAVTAMNALNAAELVMPTMSMSPALIMRRSGSSGTPVT